MAYPLIIGIAGKKRSGKDTLCEALLPMLRGRGLIAQRRALADSLKDEAADALWPHYRTFGMAWGDVRSLLDDYATKEDYRPLLQWWGTSFRRDMFGEDYWLQALDKWIKQEAPGVVIVPDVRFPSEADWVHSLGGKVIRIERPSKVVYSQVDLHISETALDVYKHFDAVVVNDGSLQDVDAKAKQLAMRLV